MTSSPSPSPSLIHHTHARLIYELNLQWGHLPPTLRVAHTFGVTDTTTFLSLTLASRPRIPRRLRVQRRLVIHTTPHYLSPLVMGEVFRRLLDRSLVIGAILDLPPPPPEPTPMPSPPLQLFTIIAQG